VEAPRANRQVEPHAECITQYSCTCTVYPSSYRRSL